ncbi:hypothetical protein J4Q44_G00378130 [Coregonus suidteri]|uniref:RRM domain-containing protein n=1 Tax=Coregonus suidteri TaxID=861788 RepID=A0AAN8KIE0_9TELE
MKFRHCSHSTVPSQNAPSSIISLFVHMDDHKSATKAIRSLHLYKLHGTAINVEDNHGKNQGAVKLHVTNVEKGNNDELRTLFEEYGTVSECAIVKNVAFVHMDNSNEALDAIKGLDNVEFQGKRIHVQISKSRPRYEEEEDYPPPPPERGGYWPHQRAYERERESYAVVDYYEKYRARPAPHDPYERRPFPPPPSAYYARDRSPIRRAPPPTMPPSGNVTPMSVPRLSPVSRPAMYNLPRTRDPYADSLPPPPPARYY